jgi:hypothetical protein
VEGLPRLVLAVPALPCLTEPRSHRNHRTYLHDRIFGLDIPTHLNRRYPYWKNVAAMVDHNSIPIFLLVYSEVEKDPAAPVTCHRNCKCSEFFRTYVRGICRVLLVPEK